MRPTLLIAFSPRLDQVSFLPRSLSFSLPTALVYSNAAFAPLLIHTGTSASSLPPSFLHLAGLSCSPFLRPVRMHFISLTAVLLAASASLSFGLPAESTEVSINPTHAVLESFPLLARDLAGLKLKEYDPKNEKQQRQEDRCGPEFDGRKCADDKCCSHAGYCVCTARVIAHVADQTRALAKNSAPTLGGA